MEEIRRTIYEVVRIKQIIEETDKGLNLGAIRSPEEGAEVATKFIGDEDREVLLVICLNTKNQINAVNRCHIGSINASVVHPREVFKPAILNNSASIIMAHNHPSQDISPSREDVNVTLRIKEAGKILGIELLDHIIVNGKSDFYSMKENNRM